METMMRNTETSWDKDQAEINARLDSVASSEGFDVASNNAFRSCTPRCCGSASSSGNAGSTWCSTPCMALCATATPSPKPASTFIRSKGSVHDLAVQQHQPQANGVNVHGSPDAGRPTD